MTPCPLCFQKISLESFALHMKCMGQIVINNQYGVMAFLPSTKNKLAIFPTQYDQQI